MFTKSTLFTVSILPSSNLNVMASVQLTFLHDLMYQVVYVSDIFPKMLII